MSLTNITFFISEAVISLRRSKMMTFITISTISVALMMMGAFLLATMNAESFLSQLQAEAMVTAYTKEGVSIFDAKNLSLRLISLEEVENVDVITPEQAAKELFTSKEDQELLRVGITLETNPLPNTLRIKIKSSKSLDPLLQKLKNEPMIDSFSYGEDLFRQFKEMSHLLWVTSLAIVIILGIASMFIVYNTIRLTLYMRKEEIIIMKLVGATNWFVRGPFLVEGLIQGIVAALFATIVLFPSYYYTLSKLTELLPFFSDTLEMHELFKMAIKLLMMGLILGISGSLLSLRDINKFSKSIVA